MEHELKWPWYVISVVILSHVIIVHMPTESTIHTYCSYTARWYIAQPHNMCPMAQIGVCVHDILILSLTFGICMCVGTNLLALSQKALPSMNLWPHCADSWFFKSQQTHNARQTKAFRTKNISKCVRKSHINRYISTELSNCPNEKARIHTLYLLWLDVFCYPSILTSQQSEGEEYTKFFYCNIQHNTYSRRGHICE